MSIAILAVASAAQIAATGGEDATIFTSEGYKVSVKSGNVVITITHRKPKKRQRLFEELRPSSQIAKDGVVHCSQPESGPWVITFCPK